MFRLEWIKRTMTRTEWNYLYCVMRKVGDRGDIYDRSRIAERVTLQVVLDRNTQDDRIGLVESGMDCDCVSYCHGSIIRKITAIQFQHKRNAQQDWADGPCNLSICKPDEMPDDYSRDLVMEAYEDGHPYSVSMA